MGVTPLTLQHHLYCWLWSLHLHRVVYVVIVNVNKSSQLLTAQDDTAWCSRFDDDDVRRHQNHDRQDCHERRRLWRRRVRIWLHRSDSVTVVRLVAGDVLFPEFQTETTLTTNVAHAAERPCGVGPLLGAVVYQNKAVRTVRNRACPPAINHSRGPNAWRDKTPVTECRMASPSAVNRACVTRLAFAPCITAILSACPLLLSENTLINANRTFFVRATLASCSL